MLLCAAVTASEAFGDPLAQSAASRTMMVLTDHQSWRWAAASAGEVGGPARAKATGGREGARIRRSGMRHTRGREGTSGSTGGVRGVLRGAGMECLRAVGAGEGQGMTL